MENVSGDGKTSPFGNGKGATSAMGASSGGNDFTKNPTGNDSKTGGNDFTKNPRGNDTSSGGTDFTKSPGGAGTKVPEQPSGEAEDIDKESVPAGGRILQADPPAGREGMSSTKSPFKLKG